MSSELNQWTRFHAVKEDENESAKDIGWSEIFNYVLKNEECEGDFNPASMNKRDRFRAIVRQIGQYGVCINHESHGNCGCNLSATCSSLLSWIFLNTQHIPRNQQNNYPQRKEDYRDYNAHHAAKKNTAKTERFLEKFINQTTLIFARYVL